MLVLFEFGGEVVVVHFLVFYLALLNHFDVFFVVLVFFGVVSILWFEVLDIVIESFLFYFFFRLFLGLGLIGRGTGTLGLGSDEVGVSRA